ncbi:MAG: hypothetical protein JWN17_975 [Frankiales bacterium]|nr:hypothetical protein [Frankiales bacterium]
MSRAQEPQRPRAVQRVAELAGVATWELDLDTGELTSSDVVRLLLELPPDAPPPAMADWFRLVHPEDKAALAGAWRRLVEDGHEYVLEHRIVVGGVVKHMRAVACLDSQHRRAYGMTQDVTEQRAAAAEVLRERDLVGTVLAALHEGVLLTDGDVILRANPAASTVTGFAVEELVGARSPYPFWPEEDVEQVRAVLLDGGGERQVRLQHADGHCFPAHLTATEVATRDGRRQWVVTLRDRTQEHAYEQRLLQRAETDPLTGVLNSKAFRERLRHEVSCSDTTGLPVSLALIDIDHFKHVNDEHGHAVGDEVLREVVARLVAAVDEQGVVARVGGEEFAVLLPGQSSVPAHRLLDDALADIRGRAFDQVGRVTASAGVAQRDGLDDDALYRLADRLLYEAKSQGRDRVR